MGSQLGSLPFRVPKDVRYVASLKLDAPTRSNDTGVPQSPISRGKAELIAGAKEVNGDDCGWSRSRMTGYCNGTNTS